MSPHRGSTDSAPRKRPDAGTSLIRNANAKALAYPGSSDGKAGHYVAKVYFPISGSWTMQLTQGSSFRPMDVGTFTVLAPVPGGADAAAPVTNAAGDPLGTALPFAAALIALAGPPPRATRPSPATHTHDCLAFSEQGQPALLPFLISNPAGPAA